MLKSDINSKAIENNVLQAAKDCFKAYPIDGYISPVYEHGHWWVRFYDSADERDRTYSVCDAEGKDTIMAFALRNANIKVASGLIRLSVSINVNSVHGD